MFSVLVFFFFDEIWDEIGEFQSPSLIPSLMEFGSMKIGT
jgi:hypothetical protein